MIAQNGYAQNHLPICIDNGKEVHKDVLMVTGLHVPEPSHQLMTMRESVAAAEVSDLLVATMVM